MTDIGYKIKKLRTELGLTLEEVGKVVGVSKSTVRKWETGYIENMGRDKIALLAKALKVSPIYLMGWENEGFVDSEKEMAKYAASKNKGIKIPVLGEVAAGIPIDAIEDIIDYEEITFEMSQTGEFFGLIIKGNSMEPKISDGDVVIVRKQSSVENGEIAVVLVNGDSATVKRVKYMDNGIMLMPTNPQYEPMFYDKQQVATLPVQIIGRVMELRAKF